MLRRNFLKVVSLIGLAGVFGKTASTVTQPTKNVMVTLQDLKRVDESWKSLCIYCRVRPGNHYEKWCLTLIRNIQRTDCDRDAILGSVERLLGDAIYFPVTGIAFPTANPYEFILRVAQNPNAKYISYTCDSLGNAVPCIRFDLYPFSKYFKHEMQENGIDVLFVSEYPNRAEYAWDSLNSLNSIKVGDGNVFAYFQTPCKCLDEYVGAENIYTKEVWDRCSMLCDYDSMVRRTGTYSSHRLI